MTDFLFYAELGIRHILDPAGYDHILFVVALCAVYNFYDWKKVAWLVTAFTLGHSLTLALATLRLVSVSAPLVEFLIPVTILITCLINFRVRPETLLKPAYRRYALAGFFGLIHGLGFSTYLRSILSREDSVFMPLLSFNLGLEAGQLVIVLFSLSLCLLLTQFLKVKQRDWVLVISGMVAGVALTIIEKNWIF